MIWCFSKTPNTANLVFLRFRKTPKHHTSREPCPEGRNLLSKFQHECLCKDFTLQCKVLKVPSSAGIARVENALAERSFEQKILISARRLYRYVKPACDTFFEENMSLRSGRNTYLNDSSALDNKDFIDRLFYLVRRAEGRKDLDLRKKFDKAFAIEESRKINIMISKKIKENKAKNS